MADFVFEENNNVDETIPIYGESGTWEKSAQTFFHADEGVVCTKIELKFWRWSSPSDNIVVRIETLSEGKPSGTLIHANATCSLVAADVAVNPNWQAFTFTPFIIPKDTSYAIVVERSGSRDTTNYIALYVSNNSDYANGGWLRQASGSWGDISGTYDISFFLYANATIFDTGLVFDSLVITENESLEIIDAGTGADVYDTLTVVENINLGLDNLFVDIFDLVVTEEIVDLSGESNLSVYDEISAQENIEPVYELNLSIYEEIAATESISLNLDELNVDIYEDILITEVAQVFDIIIEVGVVVDIISIQETTVILLDNLYLAMYDESSITEYIEILDLIIGLYAEDNLIIDETSNQGLDVLNYNRYDEIAIEENVTPALIINANIYDQVSITEQVSVVDLVVEVTAIENITATEWTQVLDLIIELNVEELIGVVENTALISIYFLTIYEDLGLAENLGVDMPINFEAVEQTGIAITTVAGW